MQSRQAKSHSPNIISTNVTETPQKAVVSATSASRVPVWTNTWGNHPPVTLQAKLTVNQPGDIYEQEADRVAQQVMRMPNPSTTIQRKCACGGTPGPTGECEECAKKRMALQRKSTQSASDTTAPAIVNNVLSSSGTPLDASTRSFMEPRFGYDFSHIRVHTDTQSALSAKAVNALAYTVGQNIVFAAGHYAPATSKGRNLLAHELTHVVQQSGNPNSIVHKQAEPYIAKTPDLDLERLDTELFWGDPLTQTSGKIGSSASCNKVPSYEILAYAYPRNTISSGPSASGGGTTSTTTSTANPSVSQGTSATAQESTTPPSSGSRTIVGGPNRSQWNLNASGLLVPARRALVVGGIHGDERGSLQIVDRLKQELDSSTSPLARDFDTIVIPRANPGGALSNPPTRTNPCGVDLNRNFPGLSGFPNLPPGQHAPPEQPEVTAIRRVIEILKPSRILALHAIDTESKSGAFADPVEDRVARELACRMALRMRGGSQGSGGAVSNANVSGNQIANNVCNVRYPETAAVSVTQQQSSLGAWASAPQAAGGKGIPVITHEVGGKNPLAPTGPGRSVDTIMPGIHEFLLDNEHAPSEADAILRKAASNAFLTGQGTTNVDTTLRLSIEKIVNDRFLDMAAYYRDAWLPQQSQSVRSSLPPQLKKVSGFRSFQAQSGIASKELAQRSLFQSKSTDAQIQQAILDVMQTISLPGFSRHHWGTELDVVSATRSDWEGTGRFVPLIPFLNTEALKFGFFHPYSDQRPSALLPHYQNEPWHLSYWPIANVLQQEWLSRITGNVLDNLIAETAKAIHGSVNEARIRTILSGIGLQNFQSNVAPSP